MSMAERTVGGRIGNSSTSHPIAAHDNSHQSVEPWRLQGFWRGFFPAHTHSISSRVCCIKLYCGSYSSNNEQHSTTCNPRLSLIAIVRQCLIFLSHTPNPINVSSSRLFGVFIIQLNIWVHTLTDLSQQCDCSGNHGWTQYWTSMRFWVLHDNLCIIQKLVKNHLICEVLTQSFYK